MTQLAEEVDYLEQRAPEGSLRGRRARVRTAIVHGVEAEVIDLEIEVIPGAPALLVAGMQDSELYARVRSAFGMTGIPFPAGRITVSPPAVPRVSHGGALDLPIALGILASSGLPDSYDFDNTVVIGGLSFEGYTERVRGVLPIALATRREGIPTIVVPAANAMEAAVVEGLRAIAAPSLQTAITAVSDRRDDLPFVVTPGTSPADTRDDEPDLADVQGQIEAKRALEIAAAGRHSLLFVGPAGTGKTMLARRLPGLLPPLTTDEAIETSAVYSVAGALPPGVGLVRQRPFRAPHHTVSIQGLLGGGQQPRPGELSLAHHGVLFLDELPEFARPALEGLRQAVSEGAVWMVREGRSVVFPADVLLVAATNPCPCGYRGHPRQRCQCTPWQVERYKARISRLPFDMTVHVDVPPGGTSTGSGESTARVRARAIAARTRLSTDAALKAQSTESSGASFASRRVARTIAALDGADIIRPEHLTEALKYCDPTGR